MAAETLVDSRAVALPDAEATAALGRRLGSTLITGDVVCLSGALGAGKTTLARGAIEAWTGAQQEVPSPTYTLVQTYDGGGKGQLWHVDLYRLNRPEEAWQLGLEDAFAEAACLIEWPERLDRLPPDRLDISLTIEGGARRAEFAAHGAWRSRLGTI